MIALSLPAIAARVPFPLTPLDAANLRIFWIVSLLSSPSMSAVTPGVGVGTVGSIGASVVSATSTSIAGSISGCGEVSGAVGAVCCGSIGSVGSVVAGERMPIVSELNLPSSPLGTCQPETGQRG